MNQQEYARYILGLMDEEMDDGEIERFALKVIYGSLKNATRLLVEEGSE
ncbi:hypothetical protein G8C92_09075 [Paenibacillus donghaensis]|nr:hypothetical protein [Paenibacillus donghaensis]MBE9914184.1 hypothetical protein [Paenibacillus donghaensis]